MFRKAPLQSFALSTVLSMSLAFAGLFSAAAKADNQFMNITFGGDTDGNPPATNTNTSLPITQPYSLGGYSDSTVNPYGDSPPTADDGTAVVVITHDPAVAAAMDRRVVMQDGRVISDDGPVTR